MPTISVIIPTYNAERTILETIASVQQQTFSDFELIIINDGSTDRTLELLNTVSDPRFKIFSYENGGPSVARNHGIAHATGKFIAFLDADDLWTRDKLELQLAALLQHPEAGVAYSWSYFMDNQGKSFHLGEPILFQGNVYAQLLVMNFIPNGSSTLVRKQAIESVGEFDPTPKSAEDWDYWLRLAACWPFVVVPKPQIFYRLSLGSLSSKVELVETSNLIVIEKAFQSAPPELQFLKKQSLSGVYQYVAQLCLTRLSNPDKAKQAAQKLQMAIRLYPQTLRSKKTQVLIIKLLIFRILSPSIGKYFLQLISKLRATHLRDSNAIPL